MRMSPSSACVSPSLGPVLHRDYDSVHLVPTSADTLLSHCFPAGIEHSSSSQRSSVSGSVLNSGCYFGCGAFFFCIIAKHESLLAAQCGRAL